MLNEWDSFYLIVGTAAGALVGLQFVVMTFIATNIRRPLPEAGAAFSTPTIVHFAVALFLSAIMRVPWQSVASLAIVLTLIGGIGSVYSVIVTRRMRSQSSYEPEFEDWLFHCVLPLIGYAMIAIAGVFLYAYAHSNSLFAIGTAALLFLLIGIHNAWDAVTYHVFTYRKEDDNEAASDDVAPSE